MGGIEGTHELSRNAPRRGKRNEVQEAVQAENKEDHAHQISGDCGSGFHKTGSPFECRRLTMASIILISIKLMAYTSRGFRFFHGPRHSNAGARLACHDEGDARPDKVCSLWY